MFEHVRRDLQRCYTFESRTGAPNLLEKARIVASNHALKGILVYRFGSWLRQADPNPVIKLPLKVIYRALDEVVTAIWGIHIHSTAKIQGGLYISHANGVLIGPATVGRDCNIGHGVTIGMRPGGAMTERVPVLGDRVFIGPGSMVFGGITIASGASVGPLTLVGRNLPPRSLAVGNPMQIVKKDYENSTLIYGTRPPPPE